jgi:hypothetical protein
VVGQPIKPPLAVVIARRTNREHNHRTSVLRALCHRYPTQPACSGCGSLPRRIRRSAGRQPHRRARSRLAAFQIQPARDPAGDWDELGTHCCGAWKPRRRKPNSSGSKKSAGSISLSIKTFVSGCPSFEPVSNEKVRFLRVFSSLDRCLITFFMIRRRKRLSRTALAGPERTVKGGQKLPRAYRRKR